MNESAESVKGKERSQLRMSAMNLLARREHSFHELQQKLSARYPYSEMISAVLDELQTQDVQSDSRFTEAFFRSRCHKGLGTYRIRRELQQRGIVERVIDGVFAEQQVDWFESVRDLVVRRFGESAAGDFKERSKRARFL